MLFQVKACNDAHIILMQSNSTTDDIYEIVIGKWQLQCNNLLIHLIPLKGHAKPRPSSIYYASYAALVLTRIENQRLDHAVCTDSVILLIFKYFKRYMLFLTTVLLSNQTFNNTVTKYDIAVKPCTMSFFCLY